MKLADICRLFFTTHKVIRYRMKKIVELSDNDVIRYCHWFCEENNLQHEWNKFREEIEAQYRYCAYSQEFIADDLCCDIQMIANKCIRPDALPGYKVDREKAMLCCNACKHCIFGQ